MPDAPVCIGADVPTNAANSALHCHPHFGPHKFYSSMTHGRAHTDSGFHSTPHASSMTNFFTDTRRKLRSERPYALSVNAKLVRSECQLH
eukprot:4377707-Amphidinium_carterae.2